MKTWFTAGALVLALTAPALAAPANVTVRVEGRDSTLLGRTAVTTTTTPVSKDGDPEHSCPGTSAIGALDVATAGHWDGPWYDGFGQAVTTILGETHEFDPDSERNYFWTFWNNYEYQNQGACSTELQEGDEVLWSVGCYGDCSTPTPLKLGLPGRAAPGEEIAATVTQYVVVCDASYNCATESQPASGATVAAGDATVIANDEGVARFTPPERGAHAVRATKEGFVPTATETVCVTDGADGFCGTAKPGEEPPAAAPCETDGADGRCGTRDAKAPTGHITGIADGQVFKRRRAPRELSGTVDSDVSGLYAVKIRLVRRFDGDCWGLSKRHDRLIRIRCSRPFWITVGDREEWSYLLDRRLAKGRYRLDLRAWDKAFNKDVLELGRNSVRFRVR